MPADDRSQTQVTLTLPARQHLRRHAAAVTQQAEAVVKQHKQLESIYTTIGGGSSGANAFESAGASVVTKGPR